MSYCFVLYDRVSLDNRRYDVTYEFAPPGDDEQTANRYTIRIHDVTDSSGRSCNADRVLCYRLGRRLVGINTGAALRALPATRETLQPRPRLQD
jgi:hypothetical protein